MYEVTIFKAPRSSINRVNKESWYYYRESGLQFKTNSAGEQAAEEAFVLTNAPEEMLTEEQKKFLKEEQYTGPSLSVGDVVRVESVVTRKLPSYFLCKSIGWEEYTGDRIRLLRYLG